MKQGDWQVVAYFFLLYRWHKLMHAADWNIKCPTPWKQISVSRGISRWYRRRWYRRRNGCPSNRHFLVQRAGLAGGSKLLAFPATAQLIGVFKYFCLALLSSWLWQWITFHSHRFSSRLDSSWWVAAAGGIHQTSSKVWKRFGALIWGKDLAHAPGAALCAE